MRANADNESIFYVASVDGKCTVSGKIVVTEPFGCEFGEKRAWKDMKRVKEVVVGGLSMPLTFSTWNLHAHQYWRI